jgi:hypothetical protein
MSVSTFGTRVTRYGLKERKKHSFGEKTGSGSAESAVKQVVGSRLNQAGMRWNPEHAEAVAHVRAAILSDRWDGFWSDFRPPVRQYRRKELPLAA